MNRQPTPASGIRSIEHVWIPMPDGVRLAARMWMPAQIPTGGVPALFEYIPYRKADMVRARDERNHPFLAQNGYVSLRVDMRGSGDSDGVMPDMYAPEELCDARHIIEWLTDQEWCNGRVGMFGTSWGGTAALQASLDAPEALKAVIAVCATHDRYEDDIHHKGGCLITDTFEWGATLPSILALPPTPQSGSDWYERWLARLENLASPVENWVREEARGTYWRHGSVKHQVERIGCPVLSVGGWSDRYSNSVMSLVDACPDKVWGIVGPWGHHYPDHGHPGPAIGFQQVALDWWDHWLRPDCAPAPGWPKLRVWLREFEPPQDALEMRNGAWVESGPAKCETEIRQMWLAKDNILACAASDCPDEWPVPTDLRHGQASGDTGYFGRYGGLPLEQSEDDARCLFFETPPLDEDMLLYGSVEVELELDVKDPRSQVCLRLNDISPQGVSSRVGLCVLNLALDDALDAPEAAIGAGLRKVRLRFHSTAYRFRAGHRMRLAIASSYWPIVWTPPRMEGLTVRPGCVSLPLLPQMPEELREAFPAPQDLPADKPFETLAAPRLIRSRRADGDTDCAMAWHQPLTTVHYSDICTTFSYETWADHRIQTSDPTSAQSVFVHAMSVDRPDGRASVTSRIRTTCTTDCYLIENAIEVSWSGRMIFSRDRSHTIERKLS
ncbi:CocE/NonD family hydrolase [Roseovarius faecimaris]|uniref:CocE/NonD family hydrolase n=1 Tax=Roseovarius faecimaris TaxID=2494550 RepID=A0A6I6ISD7_9RHOB|nr:CocE/NonD family hydrolase [Roseovarius faecimaris]QGX99112.1 CocE/NonD family hydrolase [Roseovarius faecimaris]